MTAEASEGREKATLADVAALAGVSPSTASLAFSGAGPVATATRERVLAAAEQLHYGGPDPRAVSLRRGRSGIVGVVMEESVREAFRDPMNLAMLDGLSDVLGTIGAALLLLTETGESGVSISSAPMDAVVLIGCSSRLNESVALLQQRGLPIVAVEARHANGVVAIDLENRESTASVARHLVELGHRRIGTVTLPLEQLHSPGFIGANWRDTATSEVAIQRLLGVEDVYEHYRGYVADTSSLEAGVQAGLALLGEPDRPTAIIAQSDLLAFGIVRAAEQLGLSVPADVSVVGFDGVRGEVDYDLTTMVQPAFEKGRAAGRAVNAMLAGEPAEPVSFTPVFHRGNTTAAPGPSR